MLEFFYKHKETGCIYNYSKDDIEKARMAAQGRAVTRDHYRIAKVLPDLIELTIEEKQVYLQSFDNTEGEGIEKYLN